MKNCTYPNCIFICVPDSDYCAKHQKKAQVVKVTKEVNVTEARIFTPAKKVGKAIYIAENSPLAIPGVSKCDFCGYGQCQGFCPASQQ